VILEVLVKVIIKVKYFNNLTMLIGQ